MRILRSGFFTPCSPCSTLIDVMVASRVAAEANALVELRSYLDILRSSAR
jgi:hypothetical protein